MADTITNHDTEPKPIKDSPKVAYILGIVGMVLTILMAIAVVYFWQSVRQLEGYGVLGAFVISILGGATIIIPVPMLTVIFALGGVAKNTWLIGVAAGLGETVGALTIYMTGRGWSSALYPGRPGKLQIAYERMMRLMERRGSLALFFLSAVLNPFFYPAALAAGALRFGIRKYFVICWAGKTIKGMTVAYAGFLGLRGLLQMLGMPI